MPMVLASLNIETFCPNLEGQEDVEDSRGKKILEDRFCLVQKKIIWLVVVAYRRKQFC